MLASGNLQSCSNDSVHRHQACMHRADQAHLCDEMVHTSAPARNAMQTSDTAAVPAGGGIACSVPSARSACGPHSTAFNFTRHRDRSEHCLDPFKSLHKSPSLSRCLQPGPLSAALPAHAGTKAVCVPGSGQWLAHCKRREGRRRLRGRKALRWRKHATAGLLKVSEVIKVAAPHLILTSPNTAVHNAASALLRSSGGARLPQRCST